MGLNRDNKYLIKGKYENRNRQCKNRNRNRNKKRWENLRIKEILRIQNKSGCLRESYKTRQVKLDQWGACNTPKVLEFDKMSIKPRKENETIGNKTFHKISKYDKIRETRAQIILSKNDAIKTINQCAFLVRSQTGHGHYLVEWKNNNWTCNCKDHIKNNRPCKHIIARDLFFNGHITIEDQIPEIEKVSYSQDWSSYNHAQANEIELFD